VKGEQVEKALRLIKSANPYEAAKATKVLMKKTMLGKAEINGMAKQQKDQEDKKLDSIPEILANTTVGNLFNKGRHIINEPDGKVWLYRKTHWVPVHDEYLGKLVFKMLDKMKAETEARVDEITIVKKAITTIRHRTAVRESKIHKKKDFLSIINCANGELWLNEDGTHTLKPHKYDSYRISCLEAEYDPTAEAPLFMDTLKGIFGNFSDRDDIIRHLGEIMGYVIQPYKPKPQLWLFQGPGGDGKSTIIEVLGGILGDAQMKTDSGILSAVGGTNSNGGGESARVKGALLGKLTVVIEEIPKNMKLNDGGLKQLANGNSSMDGRFIYGNPFKFDYIGSLIMCANHYPHIGSVDDGVMRRANVIPFNASFHKSGKEDLHRVRRILSNPKELSGILNFMLDGYKRQCERGKFLLPDSCAMATNEWKYAASNVARFMHEETEVCEGERLKALDLYSSYHVWCQDVAGVKERGRNSFYSELESLSYTVVVGHSNMKYVPDVKLKRASIDFESDSD
jgi:P4 family phage/plasmid primase-like protien